MDKKKNMEQLVINVSQGIYPPYEVFYLESIRETSKRALNAFHRYYELLEKGGEKEAIATAIHEAMIHSAALSKYFWPVRQNPLHIARAAKLREHFQISENSPLKVNNLKELRDMLEHYDERLDKFLLEEHVGFFYPRSIIDSVLIAEGQLDKIFRLVDPAAEIFVLLGEQYQFGGIKTAIENIFNEAVRMIGYGGRLLKTNT